ITLVNAKLTDSYIAAFMPFFPFVYPDTGSRYLIKTQILLNSAYFLNIQRMEASIKNAVEVGHFPPNSNRYSTVAHEFGHYLSFLAMMKENKLDYVLISDLDSDTFIKSANAFADGSFSLKMMTEAYENYKSKTNTSMSLLEFRSSISAYAVAKDNKGEYIYDETIAEAFHDYYLNKNKSKDASKEIVSVLNKYLGGS
ncbi:MAG: hypothetical protein GX758_04085, partial [Tenericutes bacterium]|nr:hypothetical protein [Mycoplasmatota bacterium]